MFNNFPAKGILFMVVFVCVWRSRLVSHVSRRSALSLSAGQVVRWAIMCVVVLALHASNAAAFTILNMAGPFACSRASATARLAGKIQ